MTRAEPTLQPVLDVLAGHAPADADEARDRDRVRALLTDTPAPRSRRQFDPGHLTASGVVVDAARRRTLLVFHRKLQRWLQPGGHLEPGDEGPAAAAAREVAEETHLATRWPAGEPHLLDVDVHEIPARGAEPSHGHFDLRYLLVAEPGPAHAGEGTEAVRWFALDELATVDLDPGLRRALRKVAWGSRR